MIARAGNRQLETDFDGLSADHGNLAAARAYLRDAAATERLFDRRLLTLRLPPAVEAIAGLLVRANQARAAAHRSGRYVSVDSASCVRMSGG